MAHSIHRCCLFVGRCWSRLPAVREGCGRCIKKSGRQRSLNAFCIKKSGRRQRFLRDHGTQRKCCFCGNNYNITSKMSTTSSWRRGECKFSGCTSCKPRHCDTDNGRECTEQTGSFRATSSNLIAAFSYIGLRFRHGTVRYKIYTTSFDHVC